MKRARKWLAALLSAVLVLGALPMAALAEEDPWAGAAEVSNFNEFKAALENQDVTSIKITSNVVIPTSEGTPEDPLDAGEKPILVGARGSLNLASGAAMTSRCPQGAFGYEDSGDPDVSQWDRIAGGMAAFLMDGNGRRLLLGSMPDNVGEAINGMTMAVLSGDVTLEEGRWETGILLVMDEGTLTLGEGCELTITNEIYAEEVNDFGELWADENVYFNVVNYNRPRLMVHWEGDNYGRSISMTPYDEPELEGFALYNYTNGQWGYSNVNADDLIFESPLSYGEMEGHERPALTARGAEWGRSYDITYGDYTPLRVFIELPEIGCYSAPGASTGSILTGSLKCSPVSSSEFYVCINPDAWFMKEGYTVSELTVEAVRYDEGGRHELENAPVEIREVKEGVWKITANGCDFNLEPRVLVTNPNDANDSFDTGTGIFLEPAETLVYSGAPLEGTGNDWGVPWKDAYKSVLRSTLSLTAGASKDLMLYLLVYHWDAEDSKPSGWYCESVNINQIRAEGVTVAQAKEDDDHIIRVTAGSAGTHKVIRMQEREVGPDEWEMIPGSTRGEPLTVTVTSSGGGSSSGGSSGSSESSPSKPAAKSSHDVSVPSGITGGTVSVQPQNAKPGETVTVTVRPEEGYALKTLSVTTAAGRKIDVTDAGDGRYTFVMPGAKVKVRASFTLVQAEEPSSAAGNFADVPAGAYYHDAVLWAVEKGITGGTSANLFSPDAPCTRAQTVTFLWRAAGSPAPSGGGNPFKDVPAGAYYHDAVLWAVEKGITGGTSAETFSPEAVVTRGQTAAFLHRAAGSPAVAGGSSFKDVPSGAYYTGAVQWAAEKGVTGGTGEGLFSPGAPCTRAQIVTFLHRSRES
ncbi:MAG: S-layer homology domain-containing protein [Dysosmobacter sp.]|nr:S-layer homology domain-containing protein [Dysosmobacter sp.]